MSCVRERHRLARSMKVDVSQSELPPRSTPTCSSSASARARSCPRALARRRRRRRRQGRLQEAGRRSTPSSPPGCWSSGLGKRDELDAERLRVAAALAAKAGRQARARPRSPGLLPGRPTSDEALAEGIVTGTILGSYRFDRFKSADPDDPSPAGARLADAAGPGERRRGRRGGPRLRRGAEPRPRPAEPALQRRHPLLPGRRAARDRLRPRRRSASRCSAARRSPRRRWAAWSRSARAAPRSRS